jgi:predicted DNA-binding mobile mystery protein A
LFVVSANRSAEGRRHLDRRLGDFAPAQTYAVPRSGWLRAIRDALGMSAAVVAKRMGVTPQAVLAMESSEVNERIRLDTLRRAADALECELVYVLLPRAPLQRLVEDQAMRVALQQLGRVGVTMALEGQGVDADDDAAQRHAAALIAAGQQWRDEV